MIGALLRRGVLAGMLAGVLAGVFGLLVGEPSLDAAIALEELRAQPVLSVGTAGGPDVAGLAGPDDVTPAEAGHAVMPRPVQKAGLVVGTALVGLAVGALFGVAAAWSVGRLTGDDWQRSLKLGGVLVAAVVVLPALAYPPMPPGAGDPSSVGTRTALYLGTAAVGLLLAGGARLINKLLAVTALVARRRQAVVGAAVAAAAALLLVVLPPAGSGDGVPAELLWSFRLSSLGTQTLLWGGTAVIFGLLSPQRSHARA